LKYFEKMFENKNFADFGIFFATNSRFLMYPLEHRPLFGTILVGEAMLFVILKTDGGAVYKKNLERARDNGPLTFWTF